MPPTSSEPVPAIPPRIRVAFCVDNMNVGGTELNAVRTAERLDRERYELSVVTLSSDGPLLDRYRAARIPVNVIRLRNLYGPSALAAGLELARHLRHERIDLVHAHDMYSNMFAGPWARWAGCGVVASRRWWAGPSRRAYRIGNRLSYHFAHRVLANSERVAQLLVEEGLPPSKVAVVRNFLEEEAFSEPGAEWLARARRHVALPDHGPVVGMLASSSPDKDQATLVRAVARLRSSHPRLVCVLVGRDAGEESALRSLVAELGLDDAVRFAGQMPSRPSPHHLFDVSVLSTRSEGLPNSVLEAMASGRPTIASDVGAVADAVDDGVTGFLVPPGDAGALAAALGRCLDDAELRRSLGAAGRERARERYSARGALAALDSLYGGVIGARGAMARSADGVTPSSSMRVEATSP